ncbi:hypothetical protein [Variovorax paradoxus]|uniref:hypothetical protein n=1 Tax=Variovorax paradoxus TaxID=34073 RepID=UPI0019318529|nr:hypothetical protein INQ48_30585 [Variovorax paradoxus]
MIASAGSSGHHRGCPCQCRKIHFSACAADPEQKIKALEVQLREANEKAQLFEAVFDVLKGGLLDVELYQALTLDFH